MSIPQFTVGQVLTSAELNVMVDAINAGGAVKVTAFTASGTFTPPTGVTYAVAYVRGAGGGNGTASAGAGGNSSVAFAGGTISASGGAACNANPSVPTANAQAGAANSGLGARGSVFRSADGGFNWHGGDGANIVAGGDVTAGVGITVTVAAGGTAGTSGAAGGSGYVYIEYSGG